MWREVGGALEELNLLGHTVAVGDIHGEALIDANGTCSLVVGLRAYPDWNFAAAPVLDRRGLRLTPIPDDESEADGN